MGPDQRRPPPSNQPPQAVKYQLLVSRASGGVETLDVGEAPIVVGRSSGAAVAVQEPSVSRRHCVVSCRGGRLLLQDQGSANGTMVNGQLVKRAELRPGDVIAVGSVSLRVQLAKVGGLYGISQRRSKVAPPLHSLDDDTTSPGASDGSLALAVIDKLSVILTTPDDQRGIACSVLEILFDLLPIDRATLLVGEPRGEPARALARLAPDLPDETPPREASRALVQRVLSTGSCVSSAEVEQDSGLSAEERAQLEGVRSVLCAPLERSGKRAGVIYAETLSAPIALTPAKLAFFEGIARRAGSLLWHDLEREDPLPRDLLLKAEQVGLRARVRDLERRLEEADLESAESRLELIVRLNELEALRRSREALSQGLVQDLRAMTDTIGLNLTTLRGLVGAAGDAARPLEAIVLETAQIVAVAEDQLASIQLEDGVFGLSPAPVAASALIEATWDRSLVLARALGVRLELGPVEEQLEVVADKGLITRVLVNLATNAIRSAGADGTVTFSASSAGDRAELRLVDASRKTRSSSTWRTQREPPPSAGSSSTWKALVSEERGGSSHPSARGTGMLFCRLTAEAHGGGVQILAGRSATQWVLTLPVADDRRLEITQTT